MVIILNKLKSYFKVILIGLLFMIVFVFLLSILEYFNLFYGKVSEVFMFIYMAILFFIIGFLVGKKATHKGYLEGIKISLSLIFILIVINVLFYQTGFSLERTIYYFILILSSTMGSMIGINKQP